MSRRSPGFPADSDRRQIILDVQPTLLPDEELADLAAAEEIVTNKENQRAVVVDTLRDELKRKPKLISPFPGAGARADTRTDTPIRPRCPSCQTPIDASIPRRTR